MDNEAVESGGSFNYDSFLNPDNFLSNDAFLTSIGINPSSTYSFANSSSPSNAQIQADINANPSVVDESLDAINAIVSNESRCTYPDGVPINSCILHEEKSPVPDGTASRITAISATGTGLDSCAKLS
jgi:hypothetical protein